MLWHSLISGLRVRLAGGIPRCAPVRHGSSHRVVRALFRASGNRVPACVLGNPIHVEGRQPRELLDEPGTR
eukprot:12409717-Alexandrium_andersonii.AAC.1